MNFYIVKFLGITGFSFVSDLIDAVSRCRAGGAHIINMSLGGSAASKVEKEAMADAFEAGILIVAAAGNDGSSKYSFPASYPSVVSIAAIASDKVVAVFSSFNNEVELTAPGVGVLSTLSSQSKSSNCWWKRCRSNHRLGYCRR